MTKKISGVNVIYLSPKSLTGNSIKKFNKEELQITTKVIEKFGFQVPIVIDNNQNVIIGAALLQAAINLKIDKIPTVEVKNLSDEEVKMFTVAINKISTYGELDFENIIVDLKDWLYMPEYEITPEELGFSSIEIDNLLFTCDFENKCETNTNEIIPENITPIVQPGDLIKLGKHLLYCGDALESLSYKKLLGNNKADIIITDAPYNVKIQGNVTKQKHHNEFANASGEMTSQEFIEFLQTAFENLADFSEQDSIHYLFMDWKHLWEIQNACKEVYGKLLNICVWNKLKGGMGSFYRSQHEFCLVYQNGTASHKNNIELGKHGRNRTNVWDYTGMNSGNIQAKKLTKLHPTVKPAAMLTDILLDASNYNDIVLDCFGGSGSTLIAAEQCGRKARLIEISPTYCDVIIYRWEEMTKQKHQIIMKGDK